MTDWWEWSAGRRRRRRALAPWQLWAGRHWPSAGRCAACSRLRSSCWHSGWCWWVCSSGTIATTCAAASREEKGYSHSVTAAEWDITWPIKPCLWSCGQSHSRTDIFCAAFPLLLLCSRRRAENSACLCCPLALLPACLQDQSKQPACFYPGKRRDWKGWKVCTEKKLGGKNLCNTIKQTTASCD